MNRRVIAFKRNTFFTYLPHHGTSEFDRYLLSGDEEKMSDSEKANKIKYLQLKSQNKAIKFERKATVYFGLNKACKDIEKIVFFNGTTEVYEN